MQESSLKNKSRSHFLDETFGPVSNKSLRLRSAAFEMQFSHGVWGLPFQCAPIVWAKTVPSLLGEST